MKQKFVLFVSIESEYKTILSSQVSYLYYGTEKSLDEIKLKKRQRLTLEKVCYIKHLYFLFNAFKNYLLEPITHVEIVKFRVQN